MYYCIKITPICEDEKHFERIISIFEFHSLLTLIKQKHDTFALHQCDKKELKKREQEEFHFCISAGNQISKQSCKLKLEGLRFVGFNLRVPFAWRAQTHVYSLNCEAQKRSNTLMFKKKG